MDKIRMFALVIAGFLFCGSASRAQEGRDMEVLPADAGAAVKLTVTLAPGQKLVVDVAFPEDRRGMERDVSIFQDKSRVKYFNSYVTGGGKWESEVNQTGGNLTFTVMGNYKTSYNPRAEWETSPLTRRTSDIPLRGMFELAPDQHGFARQVASVSLEVK